MAERTHRKHDKAKTIGIGCVARREKTRPCPVQERGLCYDFISSKENVPQRAKNEIGQLYNGEEVQVYYDCTRNGYTWVYFPKLNKSGWVNSNFVK